MKVKFALSLFLSVVIALAAFPLSAFAIDDDAISVDQANYELITSYCDAWGIWWDDIPDTEEDYAQFSAEFFSACDSLGLTEGQDEYKEWLKTGGKGQRALLTNIPVSVSQFLNQFIFAFLFDVTNKGDRWPFYHQASSSNNNSRWTFTTPAGNTAVINNDSSLDDFSAKWIYSYSSNNFYARNESGGFRIEIPYYNDYEIVGGTISISFPNGLASVDSDNPGLMVEGGSGDLWIYHSDDNLSSPYFIPFSADLGTWSGTTWDSITNHYFYLWPQFTYVSLPYTNTGNYEISIRDDYSGSFSLSRLGSFNGYNLASDIAYSLNHVYGSNITASFDSSISRLDLAGFFDFFESLNFSSDISLESSVELYVDMVSIANNYTNDDGASVFMNGYFRSGSVGNMKDNSIPLYGYTSDSGSKLLYLPDLGFTDTNYFSSENIHLDPDSYSGGASGLADNASRSINEVQNYNVIGDGYTTDNDGNLTNSGYIGKSENGNANSKKNGSGKKKSSLVSGILNDSKVESGNGAGQSVSNAISADDLGAGSGSNAGNSSNGNLTDSNGGGSGGDSSAASSTSSDLSSFVSDKFPFSIIFYPYTILHQFVYDGNKEVSQLAPKWTWHINYPSSFSVSSSNPIVWSTMDLDIDLSDFLPLSNFTRTLSCIFWLIMLFVLFKSIYDFINRFMPGGGDM